MKFILGLIVSFAVGVGCRYFDVPVGSPAALPGAFIVLAMTAGYSWTNQALNARSRFATTSTLRGGPTGHSAAHDPTSSHAVIVSASSPSAVNRYLGSFGDCDPRGPDLEDGSLQLQWKRSSKEHYDDAK